MVHKDVVTWSSAIEGSCFLIEIYVLLVKTVFG